MKKFLSDIFKSESPVSSRRLIAVFIGIVLLSYVIWKGVTSDNAIEFLHALLVFLAALLGLTTYQNVVKVKKGDREFTQKSVGGENPKPDEDITP